MTSPAASIPAQEAPAAPAARRGWSRLRFFLRLLRQRPLVAGIGGTLAGFTLFVLPEIQLIWMLALALVYCLMRRHRSGPSLIPRDVELIGIAIAAFLGWSWSSVGQNAPRDYISWAYGVSGMVALLLFMRLCWLLGQRPGTLQRVLVFMVITVTVTSVVSAVIFYGFRDNPFPRSRMENQFVYLGLHTVNTAMFIGITVVLALGCGLMARNWKNRWLFFSAAGVLFFCVLLTATRGALLGIAAAAIVFMTQKQRLRMISPALLFVGIFLFYQALPALLYPAGSGSYSPTHQFIARQDSGRFSFYEALISLMNGPREFLFGTGFWARDHLTYSEIGWFAHHPHSAYVSTFYHTGVLGMLLLGPILWIGWKKALWLSRRGLDPRWAPLLAFGTVALIFDGQSFATFNTVPGFEPLIFWFPLILACAVAHREWRKLMRQLPAAATTKAPL